MDDDGNLPLRKQSSFELRAGYTTRMLEDKSWCCATLALENTADSIIDASRGTGTLKAAHNVSSHVPGSWKIEDYRAILDKREFLAFEPGYGTVHDDWVRRQRTKTKTTTTWLAYHVALHHTGNLA